MTSQPDPQDHIIIRELHTLDDMIASENIQLQVWGNGTTPHPKEILIAVQYEGGFLAGAFSPDEKMVGLIFSFPTRDPSIHHSQLLAVLDEWRGKGIGTRLKWFQREWCMNRGINHVRWTVDPLRVANAVLNIQHLGGISSTYLVDFYGEMHGIDAGVPTDRLLLDWFLDSQRVLKRAAGKVIEDHDDAQPVLIVSENRLSDPRLDINSPRVLVPLPPNFIQMSKLFPEKALEWRVKTREIFLHYFSRKYQIIGFSNSNGPAYLLERKDFDGS